MNNIILCGFVVRNPEMRESNNGKKICSFDFAVKRNAEKSDFFKCITFGEKAELCNKWFKKGSRCVLSGAMQNDQYKDKNGKMHDSWHILVKEIEFISKLRKNKDEVDVDGLVEITPSGNNALNDIFGGGFGNLPF